MAEIEMLNNVRLVFTAGSDEDPPTVGDLRHALSVYKLNVERAEEIPDSTAFRRAMLTYKKADETAVSIFKRRPDDVLCAQIDTLEQEDGRQIRKHKSTYELTETGAKHVSGEYLPEVDERYEHAKTVYTWGDVGVVIKEILTMDSLGAHSPKKNGGIYYAPVKADSADILDRITNACERIKLRFLQHGIPDTAAHRAEIADAISVSFSNELDTHQTAIESYDVDTRGGIMSNRREALTATESLLGKLRHLVNGRADALTARIRELNAALDRAEQAASAHALAASPTPATTGGRRIMTGAN